MRVAPKENRSQLRERSAYFLLGLFAEAGGAFLSGAFAGGFLANVFLTGAFGGGALWVPVRGGTARIRHLGPEPIKSSR